MSTQLEFGLSRATDPDTSYNAGRSVDPTPLEALVLGELRRNPLGLTTEELSERLGLSLVTVSPRIRPLVNKGKVIGSIEKRKNRSGRNAMVWLSVSL